LFVTYNFAGLGIDVLKPLTLGFGAWGPPRSDTVWPSEGGCDRDGVCQAGQRYNQVDSRNMEVHYSLAAGYELPWYRLRLGVGLQLIDQIVDMSMKLDAAPNDLLYPEETDYEAYVKIHTSSLVPCAQFALSGAPFDWLILSMVFQLPYNVRTQGNASVTLGQGYYTTTGKPIAEVSGDQVSLYLNMPAVLRTAVQYDHPSGLFDFELALVWEGWSQNQEIRFVPENIGISIGGQDPQPIGQVNLINRWNDTYSIRAGGELVVLPDMLLVRAGGYYEQSPVPFRYTNVGLLDLDKWAVTGGARLDLPVGAWLGNLILSRDLPASVWLDYGMGYVWWRTRRVQRSEIVLTNVLTGQTKHAIGNGTYTNAQVYMQGGVGIAVGI
jgi:hypothetical protein